MKVSGILLHPADSVFSILVINLPQFKPLVKLLRLRSPLRGWRFRLPSERLQQIPPSAIVFEVELRQNPAYGIPFYLISIPGEHILPVDRGLPSLKPPIALSRWVNIQERWVKNTGITPRISLIG